jgi:hypothetical protein
VHIDPILLAQSQDGDAVGYILVAHEVPRRTFDLLFIHGPMVVECARMTPDSRFPIDVDTVRATFLEHRHSSTVHLFLCTAHEIERFMLTLHSEPCLKVHVNAISRRQIRSLIKATGCRNGILERNIFQIQPPRVELVEIDPQGSLPQFKTGLKTGRLLLYDLEKTGELKVKNPITARIESQPLKPPRRKGSLRVTKSKPAPNEPPQTGKLEQPPLKQGIEKSQIDEFDELIKQILASPLSTEPPTNATPAPAKRTKLKQRTEDAPPQANLNTPDKDEPKSVPQSDNDKPTAPVPIATTKATPESTAKTSVTHTDDPQKYVRIFQRLFRSFRQQAFECFGPRCETVITQAEQQVRLLDPELDMERLDESTAILILDVIEGIITRAPFLKKSKLRSAAQILISDLYNKHYDLLEQHNVIDKVEQNYYQLKK